MFDEQLGSYGICAICGWQDDDAGLRYPLTAEGPNRVSFFEAQKNSLRFGAIEVSFRYRDKRPNAMDVRVPGWRPLNLSKDVPPGGGLYYWENVD